MVAGVRDQYSGDCERVQVVDSTGDAGCSVTRVLRIALLLILIYSIVLICKSLWIKTSAK